MTTKSKLNKKVEISLFVIFPNGVRTTSTSIFDTFRTQLMTSYYGVFQIEIC